MEFTISFIRIFCIVLAYTSPILIILLLVIAFLGLLVGKKEGWSKLDALYFSFVTAATVGYGDLYPTKKSSKLLAIAIAVVGLLLTGIVVAIGLHSVIHAFEKTRHLSNVNHL